MSDPILNYDSVIREGVNFDLLSYNSDMTRVLTDFEVCGGEPFNGLAYELTRTKKLAWYAFYRNGVRHGQCVIYTPAGNVERTCQYTNGNEL